MEKALILTVATMVVLVLVGLPWLAILVGIAGAMAMAAGAPKKETQVKSFGDVDVPEAGGYPGWDFWKKLLEDSAGNIWELVRTFTGVQYGIDAWSEGMRADVWQQGKPTHEYMPYGVYAVPKKFAPEMARLDFILRQIQQIDAQIATLTAQLPNLSPRSKERKIVQQEIDKLLEKKRELQGMVDKILKKGFD